MHQRAMGDNESINFVVMKKCLQTGRMMLLLLTAVIGLSSMIHAQTNHYVFFQTENNQPFYLRLMGATLSSNATGYLLIPKLTNGQYDIWIGFAQNDKEHKFNLVMQGKDLGFSLKQELDNNWSLFNLVDFSLMKGEALLPAPVVTKAAEPEAGQEVDKQAEPVVATKEQKQETTKPAAPKKEAVRQPKPVLPEVRKIYDKISSEGVDMVFVVSGNPKNDTVILYVPALKRAETSKKNKIGIPGTPTGVPNDITVGIPPALDNRLKVF